MSAQPLTSPMRQHLHGRIRDVDTHEMLPAGTWVREYGPMAEPLAEFFQHAQPETHPNSFSVRRTRDEGPITSGDLPSAWKTGCGAPGAFNMHRRLQFMDVAGIRDCLVFGSLMSFLGQQFASDEGGAFTEHRFGIKLPFDAATFGRMMVTAHNDWCVRTAAISPRLRPVAALLPHSLDAALAEAERMIRGGVRAVSLPTGETIEGKAPAHPDNDGLWSLLERHRVALLLHIGGEKSFVRRHTEWLNAPVFSPKSWVPSEVAIDPFTFATCSLAPQAFLTNLVLGGVFERFPSLRCGIMELSGFWIGPVAENMDLWAGQYRGRLRDVLSMPPSEYVRRNVRVSPFSIEPVDRYVDRHPFLADVLCFSSDYPHFEGGADPVDALFARVERLGDDFIERFFVRNADWLMPAGQVEADHPSAHAG